MFSSIRKLWREARGDVLRKEANDIIARYETLGGYERYELVSAFNYLKTNLENKNGNLCTWSMEKKTALAKEIKEAATKSWHRTPSGANGLALLSIYLEAQTLPGEHAADVVQTITDWHAQASARELGDK